MVTSNNRGLYAVVPRGFTPEEYPVDPYLLAGHLAVDAVLSHHSTLQFHGKAYSVHHRFTYLTRHARRSFSFRGQEYVAIPFSRALLKQQAELFGVTTERHVGGEVRVTSLERTLVDVLVRPDLGGGWEEVWRSLESVEYFDLEQVTDYTLKLRNATAVAKVGVFLEQHRDARMVTYADFLTILPGWISMQIPGQPAGQTSGQINTGGPILLSDQHLLIVIPDPTV